MPKLKSFYEISDRLKRGEKFIHVKSQNALVYQLSPTNDPSRFGMKYDGMMISNFYVFLMPAYLHIVFTFGAEIQIQKYFLRHIKFIND